MTQAMYRRRFLQHLMASPLFAALAQSASTDLITDPDQAINLFDLRDVAQKNIAPQHWGYLMTGSDDDGTIKANREGFERFRIRPRRFNDVSKIDQSIEMFGRKYPSPIFLSPAGSQGAFHGEGELATARAAGKTGHQMTLSTTSTTPVGDVAKAYGHPLWFQLYPTPEFSVTEGLIRRAEDAGCPLLALTVDSATHSNRETFDYSERASDLDCSVCHKYKFPESIANKANFRGLDVSMLKQFQTGYNWKLIDRIRKFTDMKLMPKGVQTPEDAEDCVRYGMDGIWVSNHGGRQLNSLFSTIESLPDIVQAVGGKIPILIDSGFRRGTDVFKALAIGADAVGIGRPYLWGLGAFGQAGVEKVLDLFADEMRFDMSLAGTPTIADITSKFVEPR